MIQGRASDVFVTCNAESWSTETKDGSSEAQHAMLSSLSLGTCNIGQYELLDRELVVLKPAEVYLNLEPCRGQSLRGSYPCCLRRKLCLRTRRPGRRISKPVYGHSLERAIESSSKNEKIETTRAELL